LGLGKGDVQKLDCAARGAFLSLSTCDARNIIDRFYDLTPKRESSSEQEEKLWIAKSQPFQSQNLAIQPEPSIPKILQGKKKFHLWKALTFLIRMV